MKMLTTLDLANVTTTERDAISTPPDGALVWNTTTIQAEVYDGSAWSGLGGGGTSGDIKAGLFAYVNGGILGGSRIALQITQEETTFPILSKIDSTSSKTAKPQECKSLYY